MITKNNHEELNVNYKTSDLGIAAYLKSIGQHFSGIEEAEDTRRNQNKKAFVFTPSTQTTQAEFDEEIEEALIEYWNEIPNCSALKMRNNLTHLRSMVSEHN